MHNPVQLKAVGIRVGKSETLTAVSNQYFSSYISLARLSRYVSLARLSRCVSLATRLSRTARTGKLDPHACCT